MFRPRKKSIQQQFLDERRKELVDATHNRDKPLENFVTLESIRRIWTKQRLEECATQTNAFDKSKVDFVKGNLLRTLSILVYIRWQTWSTFKAIFLGNSDAHRHRLDRRVLEYTLRELEDNSFLGTDYATDFLNCRYIFYPITLEEGRSLKFSKEWRLPLVNIGCTKLGQGSSSRVTRETIAREQLLPYSEHHLPRVPYSEEILVARKCFVTKGDSRHEARILESLRSSLSKHEHILSYLATVTVGDEFNILLPLADTDLERFLAGEYRDRPTPHDLISEAGNIAGALFFLHNGLQLNDPRLSCCHLDLKPDNILVFYTTNSPVGKWKISDFGISVITQPERGVHTSTVDFTDHFTYTVKEQPRAPGTYQAPEVCSGDYADHRSDVWSFGCILLRVLALGIDGLERLQALDHMRGMSADGQSYYSDDYFHRGSPAALNPHIKVWVNGLLDRSNTYGDDFTKECRQLLLSALAILAAERPTARDIQIQLNTIKGMLQEPEGPYLTPSTTVGSLQPSSESLASEQMNVKWLVNAIRLSDCVAMKKFLDLGVNLEDVYENERPLIHAIKTNNWQVVYTLLQNTNDLNLEAKDSENRTPLLVAADIGSSEIIEELIKSGAVVDARSENGITPLMQAARKGHAPAVSILLNYRADGKLYAEAGWSSLHWAVHGNGTPDIINLLITGGKVDVNIENPRNHETPLLLAIKEFANNPEWWKNFDALLERGADVNKKDTEGHVPLFVAVKGNLVRVAKKLVARGAIRDTTIISGQLSREMGKILNSDKGLYPSGSTSSSWIPHRRKEPGRY